MTGRTAEASRELLDAKRLLIFDFDGTLADTSPFHEAAFNAVLAPWGLSVNYTAIAGLRTRDALAACFDGASLRVSEPTLQELIVSKQASVRTLIQRNLRPIPGVDAFLRWARPRYRLALYSCGSRGTVEFAIEKLGYMGWFDPMLCAEDVAHAKPDPEGFLKILAITGLPVRDVLIFEDSNSGVTSALATGCDVLNMSEQPQREVLMPAMNTTWNELLSDLQITY